NHLVIGKIFDHSLKTGACRRGAIQRAIRFPEIKKGGRPIRGIRIEPEEFFGFRNREIVEFASEGAVSVVQLRAFWRVGGLWRAGGGGGAEEGGTEGEGGGISGAGTGNARMTVGEGAAAGGDSTGMARATGGDCTGTARRTSNGGVT